MATTSYGSITIVDITDIGQFSVYPKCNSPITIIYSPDGGTYTPNWQNNNLIITPVVYYAGSQVDNNNITWTWQRQVGNGSIADISSSNGEYQSDGSTTIGSQTYTKGTLVVRQNQFTNINQLTYIVTATYPSSSSGLGRNLVAQGQITFSKIVQGTSAKIARITGENVIKYAGDGSIISPKDENQKSYITLTGTVAQCNISSWQYKNGNTWTTYPAKSNANPGTYPSGAQGTILNVYADDSTFSGDRVTIRLQSNDINTYDDFTIYKIRDGAAGTSTLTAILTNEDQMIPANASGTPINLPQSGAISQIKILRGGADVTASENWTISATADNGITFNYSTTSQTNDTVTVASMSNDLSAGNIYFTATKDNTTLTKTFSLVKVKGGADASTFTIYSLEVDTLALNYNQDTGYTPDTINANAFQTVVSPTGVTKSSFSGKWKIIESYNNGTADVIQVNTNAAAASSKQYTPIGDAISKIKFELYDNGGNNKLDTQTVVVTTDGEDGGTGPQGPAGNDAVSILLGNEAEIFPCNSSNHPLNQITVNIPFGAYKGTSRVAATVTSVQLLGINPHTDSHSATASSDGLIKYIIPTSKQITANSGLLNLEFTCEGQTFNKVFSWTRSSASVDGITMLLFTPNSTYFDNGTGELTVQGYLQSGNTNVTNTATWKWYQYDPTAATPGYVELPAYNSLPTPPPSDNAYYVKEKVTVKADAISGYGSFKVEAAYGGKTYTQYISLVDKTDPLQVSIHSTIGTQIVNGQGAGALYVRVTRNGEEIDPIGNSEIVTGTAVPASSYGNNGDHYIVLNSSNKTATLYYKNGGTWGVQSLIGTYEWTFRNANNAAITTGLDTRFGASYNSTTGKVTGKCLYVDATTVDNKITADVKVTV